MFAQDCEAFEEDALKKQLSKQMQDLLDTNPCGGDCSLFPLEKHQLIAKGGKGGRGTDVHPILFLKKFQKWGKSDGSWEHKKDYLGLFVS